MVFIVAAVAHGLLLPPTSLSWIGQPDGWGYASEVALSATVSCAATLPFVAVAGKRAIDERAEAANRVPEEPETPYVGGADSYSPDKATEFYSKRPLLVASRLVGLLQATLAFQVKLLIDWRFGWLEQNEKDRAREALALVEELGPTFIKLGQALSIRTDLIPEAYALELRKLQDAVPPFPDSQAREVMKRQLGVDDLDEIFEDITKACIASASIGQVYKGTLRPSEKFKSVAMKPVSEVAVKVQRPGVLSEIALDLYLLRLLAPIQTRISNAINKVPTSPADIEVALALVDEWGRGFVNEVDYKAEARNTEKFSAAMNGRGLGAVVAPRVVQELSTSNVLVTEWIEGTRLDSSASPDVPRLCDVAIGAYLTMLLDTGTLHCDPHPGNLLRTTDGKLCILDWGMTLDVPKDLQYSLLEFIAHINTGDLERIPRDFVNLGFTPPDKIDRVKDSGVTDGLAFMLRQLAAGGGPAKIRERVKAEFVERYGDIGDEELRKKARAEMMQRMEAQLQKEGVDVKGVSNVMQEMSKRNRELFQLPTWVLYVVRAFSTLEGIGLSIDDNYSIIQECYPYLARRLFLDDSPRATAALETMLASDGRLDFDKLVEMADGFTTYAVNTKGVDLATMSQPAATGIVPAVPAASSSVVPAEKPGASPATLDAQRELAAVLLAKNGSLAQKLVIDETARVVDAAVRSSLASALDSTGLAPHTLESGDDTGARRTVRDAVNALRGLPTPARIGLLPITAPVEVAAAAAAAAAPLVKPDDSDRAALKTLNTLSNLAGNLTADRGPPAPADAVNSLASFAPDGDIASLVTADNLDTASLIGRRFAATLLRRAASRIDHVNNDTDAAGAQFDRQLSSNSAAILADAARQAARVITPSSPRS